MSTLHWQDEQAEIHKVVVGPMDNNVYVLRCTQTGDAVLLDAANEHERLLDLCRAPQTDLERDRWVDDVLRQVADAA